MTYARMFGLQMDRLREVERLVATCNYLRLPSLAQYISIAYGQSGKYRYLQFHLTYLVYIHEIYGIENLQKFANNIMTEPIPDNLCIDKNYICISSSVSKDDMKMKFVHIYY